MHVLVSLFSSQGSLFILARILVFSTVTCSFSNVKSQNSLYGVHVLLAEYGEYYIVLPISITTVGLLTPVPHTRFQRAKINFWLICTKDNVLPSPWHSSFCDCCHYRGNLVDSFVIIFLLLNKDLYAIKQRLFPWSWA